jgi:hypothetical protein
MTGKVTPFDAATGNLNPDLTFDTLLEKDSVIQSLPVMQKLQKNLDKAKQAGLKMKSLTAPQALLHRARVGLLDPQLQGVEQGAAGHGPRLCWGRDRVSWPPSRGMAV